MIVEEQVSEINQRFIACIRTEDGYFQAMFYRHKNVPFIWRCLHVRVNGERIPGDDQRIYDSELVGRLEEAVAP